MPGLEDVGQFAPRRRDVDDGAGANLRHRTHLRDDGADLLGHADVASPALGGGELEGGLSESRLVAPGMGPEE